MYIRKFMLDDNHYGIIAEMVEKERDYLSKLYSINNKLDEIIGKVKLAADTADTTMAIQDSMEALKLLSELKQELFDE